MWTLDPNGKVSPNLKTDQSKSVNKFVLFTVITKTVELFPGFDNSAVVTCKKKWGRKHI